MSSSSTYFTPKQVAEALQVSESSVKRWCDAGLIPATRTGGGHRRIPSNDLFRYLAASERPLLKPELLGLTDNPTLLNNQYSNNSSVENRQIAPETRNQQAFRIALVHGDEQQCRGILQDTLLESENVSACIEHLIAHSMICFGEMWESNELDPYQERRGCDICLRLIHELQTRFDVVSGPIAIGGSPSGNPYQLPTAMVELALREAGWRAKSLGADLPFSSFSKAICDLNPKLVWLSVSNISEPVIFEHQFNTLSAELPDDCVLIVGGRGLTDSIRPRLKYTAHCDNICQLVGFAEIVRHRTTDLSPSLY